MEAASGETVEVQIPVSGIAEVVLDTSKKPKRQATAKQLESLARAREKARLNREALRKAEAEAGGLKNIIDGKTAESVPADGESVVAGKRKADAEPNESDVPLAKRTASTGTSDTVSPVDSTSTATEPVAAVSTKKSKGKGKASAKGAPLLWMPCEDPREFGIKLKKNLVQFPPV